MIALNSAALKKALLESCILDIPLMCTTDAVPGNHRVWNAFKQRGVVKVLIATKKDGVAKGLHVVPTKVWFE